MIRLATCKQAQRLKTDQVKEFKASIAASKTVLDFLRGVLQEKVEETERSQVSKANYETPNFPYLMADYNATKRSYREIINLLSEVDNTNG